jgi:hypothetical protein
MRHGHTAQPTDEQPSLVINPPLSEPDAARYIGMSAAYLRASRLKKRRGTPGPPYVKIGKTVRYLPVDLDGWLRAHRVEVFR